MGCECGCERRRKTSGRRLTSRVRLGALLTDGGRSWPARPSPAPGTPGALLSARNQCVGHLVAVRDSGIDAPTIRGGAPLDPAGTPTRPGLRSPSNVTVSRIQGPIDAALQSESNKTGQEVSESDE